MGSCKISNPGPLVYIRSTYTIDHMNEQEALERYFAICKRIYEQMERDGTWPWEQDSSNQEDLVELENNNNDI